MATNILMPALSPTMTEGTLARWLKKEGEQVRAGDVIAEIETDKATMEVEAVEEGVLGKILVPDGTANVKVNAPIAILVEDGESADAAPEAKPAPSPAAATPAAPVIAPVETASGGPAPVHANGHDTNHGERVIASPLARRMAKQAGLDLSSLKGSGPNGRIIRVDIEAAAGKAKPAAATASAAPAVQTQAPLAETPQQAPAPKPPAPAITTPHRLVPNTTMRKVIARRLLESHQTVPFFFVTLDIEIDALLALRAQLNAKASKDGPGAYKLSVNDFVIKACAATLRRVPEVNASYTESDMVLYDDVDIAVAVSLPTGLITPIVRQADRKGLATISTEIKDLGARAKAGKLKPEEFQGGTFSISNMGMFGTKQFTAIINPPQAAILAVGAGEPRPVVKNGALAVATVMTCTLSVDHRVADGALGAQWMAEFKKIVEDPLSLMLIDAGLCPAPHQRTGVLWTPYYQGRWESLVSLRPGDCSMETTFDLIVVGGGPGGYVAAIRAAQLGMKTAIVEREHLGGICLNWGCIPTRALLRSSEINHLLHHLDEFGFAADNIRFDLQKVVKRSRGIAKQLSSGVAHLLKKNKITSIDGLGKLAGKNMLAVSKDGKDVATLTAPHIILATGARARELPGLESDKRLIWTYRDAMVPPAMPKSLLVIGSGAIGIEFASFYRNMGAEVTVVEVMDRILPVEDEEISAFARKAFEKQGIKILTNAKVTKAQKNAGSVTATIEIDGKAQEITAERLISAVGIVGNVENLGLEGTQVKVDRTHIVIDEFCRTGEPGVYAIGDVVGAPWLAHKASHEGVICVEAIARQNDVHPLDVHNIPGCTYSRPQIASVGLTEARAKAAGHKIRVGRFPFIGNGKAIAMGEPEGMVKTIFDEETGELLGAHMIGAEVTEMIQGYTIARDARDH